MFLNGCTLPVPFNELWLETNLSLSRSSGEIEVEKCLELEEVARRREFGGVAVLAEEE